MSRLPEGWAWASVDDCVDERRAGYWGAGEATRERPTAVRVIRNGDISEDEVISAADRYFSQAETERSALQPSDVLMTTSGDVGKLAMGLAGYCASNFVRILRPSPRLIEGRYLRYALMTRPARAAMQSWVGGSTIQNLRSGFFAEPIVPAAPLNEQRRIVAAIEERFSRLDAADESLALARRRLRSLRAGLLAAALDGWPERQLGEISEVYVGTTPSRRAPESWGGGVPWVSSGEVAFCRIRQTRETISPDALTSPDRLHPPGTVLLAMIGEGKTRGQAAILDVAAAHNQNSAAIRLDQSLCAPEWLFYVLMARYEETRRAGSGAQQPALNRARVRALNVPLPPLEEQHRIVAEVEQRLSVIDAMRAAIEAAKARSAALRRSILERAFRGELAPQNPGDEPASVLLERIAVERASAPKPVRRRKEKATT